MLREYWLLIGENSRVSCHTWGFGHLLENKFALGWWNGQHVQILLQYSLLSGTNFFATDNNLNCCQTGLNVASKVRNIAIQPTLQQCCKTSRRFLPVSCFTVAYKISSVPIRCKPLWYLRSDRCMHGNYYGMFRIVHGMLNWVLTVVA